MTPRKCAKETNIQSDIQETKNCNYYEVLSDYQLLSDDDEEESETRDCQDIDKSTDVNEETSGED